MSHQNIQCQFNDVEACGGLKAEVKQSRADGGRSRSSDRALNLPLSQTCGEFSRGSQCALDRRVQLVEHMFIQKRIHPMTNSSKKKKFIQTYIHPKQFHPHAHSCKTVLSQRSLFDRNATRKEVRSIVFPNDSFNGVFSPTHPKRNVKFFVELWPRVAAMDHQIVRL